MNREQRIEQLYHAAMEREPGERKAFVAEACGGDVALRVEVEELLWAGEQSSGFLMTPALELEARQMGAEIQAVPPGLLVGHDLSHYRILSLIGSGGMGEVYLAKDLILGRQVALKLLPETCTSDPDRLRRFIQEARAASALNHPNILTVYEIGEASGAHFMASEFVDGQTLREHLETHKISLPELLDLAMQVTGALAAAHAAGIIHRDIKPENIMVRRDGYVKVLDFGLAKLVDAAPGSSPGSADSQMVTLRYTISQPGTVLGTVNYMSPEQARGQEVDGRTDIFSLGVVLYELVSGQAPFKGATALDTLVSILEREAPPLTEHAPDAPEDVRKIVDRAISKDKEQRYQSANDLLADLRNLKEDMTLTSRRARPLPSKPRRPSRPVVAGHWGSRRFTVYLVVAALAVAIATGLILRRPAPNIDQGSPQIGEPERSIIYSITVQKFRDGRPYNSPFKLSDEINFEKDYRIRVTVVSPQSGYLYLFNEGPPASSGAAQSFNVLFPAMEANDGSAQLRENLPVQVPQRSWLKFDQQEGTEKIWLVWADRSIAELEAVKGYASPQYRGEIGSTTLNAAVRDFLKTQESRAASVARNERMETVVEAKGDVMVHVVRLQHH